MKQLKSQNNDSNITLYTGDIFHCVEDELRSSQMEKLKLCFQLVLPLMSTLISGARKTYLL